MSANWPCLTVLRAMSSHEEEQRTLGDEEEAVLAHFQPIRLRSSDSGCPKSVGGFCLVGLVHKWGTGQEYSYINIIPDIWPFSPRAQFLVKFFSMQKRVIAKKIDSATKQRKLQQNLFCNKTHDRFFSIFTIRRHFSHWQFVMWRISPHDNLSCGEISPHDRFFFTGTACDKYHLWSTLPYNNLNVYSFATFALKSTYFKGRLFTQNKENTSWLQLNGPHWKLWKGILGNVPRSL